MKRDVLPNVGTTAPSSNTLDGKTRNDRGVIELLDTWTYPTIFGVFAEQWPRTLRTRPTISLLGFCEYDRSQSTWEHSNNCSGTAVTFHSDRWHVWYHV